MKWQRDFARQENVYAKDLFPLDFRLKIGANRTPK